MQRPGGRTERVRKEVVAATVAILADAGVTGVTIDAVASRSGVARTTIYRRWKVPEALLLEALWQELAPRASRGVDTGSLRGDLKALLADIVAFVTSTEGGGIMQALFIQHSSAEIALAVREYWAARFDAVGSIVRRAIARGELPDAGWPERFIIEQAAAPVYFRLIITREGVDEDYIDQVVDFVLAGCQAKAAIDT
jgi:AcrR family transcriptional regulator